MRLGCNTLLFAAADLGTALEQVAMVGFEFVELASVPGMCEHVGTETDRTSVENIRRLLEDYALTATAIEVALPERDRLERTFDLAAQLGIGVVNIGSGGVSGDEESTREAIEQIAVLARLAAKAGVTLAVKPHVGNAIYDNATGMRLMDEVDEPGLGLNFDPSHIFRAGEEPADVATAWGDRIVMSHIRDCTSRDAAVGPPETQIPGRGVVDLPAVLRAMVGHGYTDARNLEAHGDTRPLNVEVTMAGSHSVVRAACLAAEARGYLTRCLQEISR